MCIRNLTIIWTCTPMLSVIVGDELSAASGIIIIAYIPVFVLV